MHRDVRLLLQCNYRPRRALPIFDFLLPHKNPEGPAAGERVAKAVAGESPPTGQEARLGAEERGRETEVLQVVALKAYTPSHATRSRPGKHSQSTHAPSPPRVQLLICASHNGRGVSHALSVQGT